MGRIRHNTDDALIRKISDLERRLSALERTRQCVRLQAPDGAAVVVGSFSDGTAGVRVYNAGGALIHNITTA